MNAQPSIVSRRARAMLLAIGPLALGCSGVIGDGRANGSTGMGGSTGKSVGAAGSGSSSGNGSGSSSGSGGGSSSGSGSGNRSGSGGGNSPGSGGGNSAGSGGESTGGTSGQGTVCDSLTSRRVRRLSRREYANVVADLLGAKAQQAASAAWPDEPTVGGFDNQSNALFVSPSLQQDIADLASQLAADANVTSVAPCATAAGSASCLQTFIRSFASKAYGRPLKDSEVTAATAVAGMGEDYPTSVKLVVEMVLQSPHTLYVTELGPEGMETATGAVALTSDEMASQISFLLTGTRPDAALSMAAGTTGFKKPADIQQQVRRLLPTPAGQAQLARFIGGWLNMGPIASVSKNPDLFPEFTPAVAAAMQQEFDQFVTTQLNGGNGTLSAFMTTPSANVPSALAKLYGADLQGTTLNTNHRRGVLSLPGVLAYNSSDVSSDPVQRGLLIRRQLLCQYVPPPPPDVLDRITKMPVDTADTTKTTRQKFEAHVNDASCAACHTFFDPIGFGMEDMDALGRFRTTENGMSVDSSGALTRSDVDGPFEGPAALSMKLAQSSQLASCMVSHFFSFSQARQPDPADQCVVDQLSTAFTGGGGRIADLIDNYMAHQTFIYRKGSP